MKKPNATARTRREKALRPREMPQEWRKDGDHMETCLLTEVGWEGRENLFFFFLNSVRPSHLGNK